MRTLVLCGILLAWMAPAFAQTSTDGAARACEAHIIGDLKSPASYAPVKITIFANGVEVIYDAANAFGALLRDKRACVFVELGGALRLENDPVVTLAQRGDDCLAKVDTWVAQGNISERTAAAFREQCSQVAAVAIAKFAENFHDLGVEYPVPSQTTTVRP
jgi:hypothetical protein